MDASRGSAPGKGGPILALSEYEQRKLDDIERSLDGDDPGLGTALDMGVIRGHRPVVAEMIFVIGFVALVAGAVTAQGLSVVGVVSVMGFLAMVVGSGLLASGRPHPRQDAGVGRGAHAGPLWRGRMQERFRGRFDRSGE